MPATNYTNPYKPPRGWKDALRKPCISCFHVEAENGFVCVDLAPGWRTAEGCITLHCAWDESACPPLWEHQCVLQERDNQICLSHHKTRFLGVSDAHMRSALEQLQAEWDELIPPHIPTT